MVVTMTVIIILVDNGDGERGIANCDIYSKRCCGQLKNRTEEERKESFYRIRCN